MSYWDWAAEATSLLRGRRASRPYEIARRYFARMEHIARALA